MRLDKFLKVSFLVKRRTLAKEVCDQGRVTVNGKTAKAGTPVAVGDEIAIRYGRKRVTVRVEKLLNSVRKEDAGQMYVLLREEAVNKGQEA